MTLGQLLRKARRKLKKRQSDIATALGVRQPTVCDWENDEAVPSLRLIRKVSKVYKITAEQIHACSMPVQEDAA